MFLEVFTKNWKSNRKIPDFIHEISNPRPRFTLIWIIIKKQKTDPATSDAAMSLCVFVDSLRESIVKLVFALPSKDRHDLRVSNKLTTRSNRRSRVHSLVLLCLMAHALFVCLTHHHDSRPGNFFLTAASVAADDDARSGSSTDSNGDSHCLSCRLQRNFVSDTHTTSLIVTVIAEALSREAFLSSPHSRKVSLLLFGRAPPLI
jgi:hypothetical protein